MEKKAIFTAAAPKAIGSYSQAIQVEKTVYLSGQIPLIPQTMELIVDDFKKQVQQVFENLSAVAKAAGGNLNQIVKLTVLLIEMDDFPVVNEVMSELFTPPYPARATFAVKALPKNARIEVEAIMIVP